jgi:chaperone BCS1
VLIMTTNHLECLDPALIRPGRVDLQVKFTLATRDQIRDMYKCMYTDESTTKASNSKISKIIQDCAHNSIIGSDDLCFDLPSHITVSSTLQPEQLDATAELFAAKVPEQMFSPAEVQGFLLQRKKDPVGALREVENWRDEQIRSRRKVDRDKNAVASQQEESLKRP